jgi:L-lactate dehydrogenase complex protein LldF
VTPRVIHEPRVAPHPAVTANLHVAAGHWAAGREQVRANTDWEAMRERGRQIRDDAIRNLPELIDALEARVTEAGGRVHRAATAAEARAQVVAICRERGATRAVKAKSMLTEEIGLNDALAAAGVEAVETDLGEYIVQALDDRPSHLLAPAVHLSAGQVAELFERESGRPFHPDDTQALVGYARGVLRERFLAAEVGITGVNLAVAETGTLILVESEGNIRLSTGLPRVHVAVMGIEKVVRDWAGAAHLMQLLPLAAHGVPAPASLSLVTGPARDGDDGPEELHLVLVDDGRSALRGTEYESALHCIRCGACLYACPVYRQIGGHAYGSTYSGPIGAVLTPALEQGAHGSDELPWLSSLCGACAEARSTTSSCPCARMAPGDTRAGPRPRSSPPGRGCGRAQAGTARHGRHGREGAGPAVGAAGARGDRWRLERPRAVPVLALDGRARRARARPRALPRPLETAPWLTGSRPSAPSSPSTAAACTSPTLWRERASGRAS